jgi:hypothetical protein
MTLTLNKLLKRPLHEQASLLSFVGEPLKRSTGPLRVFDTHET